MLVQAKQQIVAFALFTQQGKPVAYRRTIALSAKPVPRFLGQWELFCQEVEQWRQLGYRVVILTSSRQRSSGITDILAERNIPSIYALAEPELAPRTVTLLHGSLGSGFILPELKLAVWPNRIFAAAEKGRRLRAGKASAWEITRNCRWATM